MADQTIVVLLGLLAVIGIAAAVFALQHRLAFRIALRNVRRGRGRTALLLLGLLVGTTIISGSLVVGSTVQQLNLHYAYLAGGLTDEAIFGPSPSGGFAFFPYGIYAQLAANATGHPGIAGITPEIIGVAQAYDRSTGIPETNLNLIGCNANQSGSLGAFQAINGSSIPGPASGMALIDQQTAIALNATTGDHLVLYGPHPLNATLEAIVVDTGRGAYLTAGLSPGDVFVDLPTAQSLENQAGRINFISVANVGSQQDGLVPSRSISAYLNVTLAAIPGTTGLVSHTPLQDAISSSEQAGMSIETIFLVLGLFSVVAGAMLIVGIFLMLAEERKGEMGMLRAIGMRRRELVFVYYFEGLVYAAGSALAGTFLGVLAGYLLTYAFSLLLSTGALTSTAILESFSFTTSDLVIAYVIGFLLTIVTVAIASSRVSRLNIVQAIRDLPGTRPGVRLYTTLGYVGGALALLGALLFVSTSRGSSDVSEPIIAGSLVILGVGLIASRFVRNRLAFTGVGLGLLLWAGGEPIHQAVLGSAHTGGIFIVFVEGILMVAGALMVYIFNSAAVIGGLLRIAGRGSRGAPIARVGLSYPGRQPTRTAVNLTIFALVTFTMVAIACFGATVSANVGHVVATQSGGYSFFGVSSQPIPSMPGDVANNSTLAAAFGVVVPLISGSVDVNVSGSTPNPFVDSLFSAPNVSSATSSFYRTSGFAFASTWNGLSAAQVLAELASNDSVAVVDQTYAPATAGVNGGPSMPHPTLTVGTGVRLTPPGTSSSRVFTVIGVFDESIIAGVWISPHAAQTLGYVNQTAYFLTVRPSVSTTLAAQEAKRAFFPEGLVLFDIAALLASSIATEEGFVGLLEIFVGLGLAVGIAAMGILALRAVVERRREIGMLRACGFTQRDVLKTFLLEYSFVTLLGLGIGTSLGILIVYNLAISPNAATSGVSTFAVPVWNILLIVVAAYALAMIAIAAPSIRASRTPPAEAVRATE